eukprot:5651144-Pleurochrysis_carterae.AAC.4
MAESDDIPSPLYRPVPSREIPANASVTRCRAQGRQTLGVANAQCGHARSSRRRGARLPRREGEVEHRVLAPAQHLLQYVAQRQRALEVGVRQIVGNR